MEEQTNWLCHHGVKGMKWGVRRYQDYNGKLTARGVARKKMNEARDLTDTPMKMPKRPLDIVTKIGSAALLVGGLSAIIPTPPTIIAGMALSSVGMFTMMGTVVYESIRLASVQSKDFVKADGPIEKLESMKRLSSPEGPDDSVKRVNRKKMIPGNGYDRNCVSCSVAMDMRSKGYDVVARRQHKGLTNGEIRDLYKGAKVKKIGEIDDNTSPQRLYDKAEQMIAKDGKGNSAGLASLTWYGGGGHCIYYQCKNGHLEFYDGQSGESKQDIDSYFKNIYEISYMRTDNLKMEEKVGECVVSDARKKR